LPKYDYLDTRIVQKTPEWVPCTYFSVGSDYFCYGLDMDEVYRFMQSIPYGGVDE